MHHPLLSLIGPTGVGKTSFALNLTKKLGFFDGFDLISVDSRQVYSDLKIISGADVPEQFIFHQGRSLVDTYFEFENCRLYGLAMLRYKDEWSVSHFRSFATEVIEKSWKSKRLPILVGGTGLYHEHLFNPSPILDIRPDTKLRLELESKSVLELQNTLMNLDDDKWQKLNHSDQNNPTRLIRAIEIAAWYKNNDLVADFDKGQGSKLDPSCHLKIGITADLKTIETNINNRVEDRYSHGAKYEVERLRDLNHRFGPNKQLLSATGVKELLALLDGVAEKNEILAKWSLREYQYAKRQLTWWKKKNDVTWLDATKPNWQQEALAVIEKKILPSHE